MSDDLLTRMLQEDGIAFDPSISFSSCAEISTVAVSTVIELDSLLAAWNREVLANQPRSPARASMRVQHPLLKASDCVLELYEVASQLKLQGVYGAARNVYTTITEQRRAGLVAPCAEKSMVAVLTLKEPKKSPRPPIQLTEPFRLTRIRRTVHKRDQVPSLLLAVGLRFSMSCELTLNSNKWVPLGSGAMSSLTPRSRTHESQFTVLRLHVPAQTTSESMQIDLSLELHHVSNKAHGRLVTCLPRLSVGILKERVEAADEALKTWADYQKYWLTHHGMRLPDEACELINVEFSQRLRLTYPIACVVKGTLAYGPLASLMQGPREFGRALTDIENHLQSRGWATPETLKQPRAVPPSLFPPAKQRVVAQLLLDITEDLEEEIKDDPPSPEAVRKREPAAKPHTNKRKR